jgi:peptide/nickel transport system permease protein
MAYYVVKRLVLTVPVLFLVAVLTFWLLRLAPGDPALMLLGLQSATPRAIAAVRQEYGLNQPVPVQFIDWLEHVLHGNLGTSIAYQVPVGSLLAERFPATIELATVALALSIIGGIPLGVLAAAARRRWVDGVVRLGSLVGLSVPSFLFGIIFVMIVGWYLHLPIPYSGWVSPSSSLTGNLSHLILPAIALALGPMAIIVRLVRSSLLEVLDQDYILTARAFGLNEKIIISVDALKNALLPALTTVGVIVAYLVGGDVAIETIFGVPGAGMLLTSALQNRDYPLISGDLLVFSALVVVINLLVDLLYSGLNPRIAQSYRRGTS